MELQKAERKQAKIKLGLQGPSGSGKTFGSLLIAYGLVGSWDKIAIIDTEFHSADLYAHLGGYKVLHLEQPFSPERYAEAINLCEQSGMQCVIIDSISHEWEFLLDEHGSMMGNSFSNWNKITPRHNAFVNRILQSSCHVIATIRSKQDYVLSEKNGKQVPEKVGMKGITRDGLDYELTLVFELDIKHKCTVTKDRTGLFADKPSFILSQETGSRIADWCREGISIAQITSKIGECKTLKELMDIYHNYQQFRPLIHEALAERKKQLEEPQFTNLEKPYSNGTIDSNQ